MWIKTECVSAKFMFNKCRMAVTSAENSMRQNVHTSCARMFGTKLQLKSTQRIVVEMGNTIVKNQTICTSLDHKENSISQSRWMRTMLVSPNIPNCVGIHSYNRKKFRTSIPVHWKERSLNEFWVNGRFRTNNEPTSSSNAANLSKMLTSLLRLNISNTIPNAPKTRAVIWYI